MCPSRASKSNRADSIVIVSSGSDCNTTSLSVNPEFAAASPQSGGGAPLLVTSPAKKTQCGARCQSADPSFPPRNAFGISTNLTSPGDKLGSDAPHQPGPAPGLSFAPKRRLTAQIGATTFPNLNIGAFTAKGWTVHDLSGVSQPSWTRQRGKVHPDASLGNANAAPTA